MTPRTNTASALTRTIKSVITPLGVKVKSDDYIKCATLTGEIEQLMRARDYLAKDTRFDVTTIRTYKVLPAAFFVKFAQQPQPTRGTKK